MKYDYNPSWLINAKESLTPTIKYPPCETWFSIGSNSSWLGSSSLSYDPPLGSSMTSPVSMTSPPRRKPLWTPPTLSAGERPHGRARNLATKCGAASLYMAYLRHGPPARNSPVSAIRFRFICIKHAQSRPNGQINSRTLDEERCCNGNPTCSDRQNHEFLWKSLKSDRSKVRKCRDWEAPDFSGAQMNMMGFTLGSVLPNEVRCLVSNHFPLIQKKTDTPRWVLDLLISGVWGYLKINNDSCDLSGVPRSGWTFQSFWHHSDPLNRWVSFRMSLCSNVKAFSRTVLCQQPEHASMSGVRVFGPVLASWSQLLVRTHGFFSFFLPCFAVVHQDSLHSWGVPWGAVDWIHMKCDSIQTSPTELLAERAMDSIQAQKIGIQLIFFSTWTCHLLGT